MIEDVPGVGKTVLAKSLARAAGCDFSRLQCTADLLPADVTGVTVWDQNAAAFLFRPGPVFANVVLVDEINRASPEDPVGAPRVHGGGPGDGRRRDARPAAALHDHRDPEPGRVRGHLPAAGGPARPLRGARRDRLPGAGRRGRDAARPRRRATPLDGVVAVTDEAGVVAARRVVERVHADPALARYVVGPGRAPPAATRASSSAASPRAGLALLRAAKARAVIEGRALRRCPRTSARSRTTVLGAPADPDPGRPRARGARRARSWPTRSTRCPSRCDGRGRPLRRARSAWRGAGAAALVASRGFGTPALATLGAGMIALPVLVTALVWLAAAGLRVERRIEPGRAAWRATPVRVRRRRRGLGDPARARPAARRSTVDPGLGPARGAGRPPAPATSGPSRRCAATTGSPPPRVVDRATRSASPAAPARAAATTACWWCPAAPARRGLPLGRARARPRRPPARADSRLRRARPGARLPGRRRALARALGADGQARAAPDQGAAGARGLGPHRPGAARRRRRPRRGLRDDGDRRGRARPPPLPSGGEPVALVAHRPHARPACPPAGRRGRSSSSPSPAWRPAATAALALALRAEATAPDAPDP